MTEKIKKIPFSLLTGGEGCAIIYENKAEVTASHLKLRANGVNKFTGKVPEKFFECGESVFHRIFCLFRNFGGVLYQ